MVWNQDQYTNGFNAEDYSSQLDSIMENEDRGLFPMFADALLSDHKRMDAHWQGGMQIFDEWHQNTQDHYSKVEGLWDEQGERLDQIGEKHRADTMVSNQMRTDAVESAQKEIDRITGEQEAAFDVGAEKVREISQEATDTKKQALADYEDFTAESVAAQVAAGHSKKETMKQQKREQLKRSGASDVVMDASDFEIDQQFDRQHLEAVSKSTQSMQDNIVAITMGVGDQLNQQAGVESQLLQGKTQLEARSADAKIRGVEMGTQVEMQNADSLQNNADMVANWGVQYQLGRTAALTTAERYMDGQFLNYGNIIMGFPPIASAEAFSLIMQGVTAPKQGILSKATLPGEMQKTRDEAISEARERRGEPFKNYRGWSIAELYDEDN